MAEVAPAPAPAKAAKKKAAAKPAKIGPSVMELVVKAVSENKERSGASLPAVKKALVAGGYDVEKNKVRVKTAIKKLVTKGTLVQVKGSFKMSKKADAVKVTKPAAKKAVKAKKPTAAKKPAAAKKSPKKAAVKKPAAAKKSPKKAKKPAAKKVVAKSPKKATKSPKKVSKKPAAAKKAPAKKVAKPKAAKKAAPKKK